MLSNASPNSMHYLHENKHNDNKILKFWNSFMTSEKFLPKTVCGPFKTPTKNVFGQSQWGLECVSPSSGIESELQLLEILFNQE